VLSDLLDHWLWFALGLGLLIVEMAGAGGYLLWIGMAAGITGGVVFLFPSLTLSTQLSVFSVVSVLNAYGWWQYQRRHPKANDEPLLNKRAEQYVGRVLVLVEAIEHGRGRAKVDDGVWSVAADEDMPVGARVKVRSLQSDHLLFVEKVAES